MNAKDLLMNFLNFAFLLGLVSLFITYFILGDRIEAFTDILKALAPASLIGIALLIKMRFNREEYKKRDSESDMGLTLYLDFIDKIWSDAIVFLTPIAVIAIRYLSAGQIDTAVILESMSVFLIMLFWQRYLFNKTNK